MICETVLSRDPLTGSLTPETYSPSKAKPGRSVLSLTVSGLPLCLTLYLHLLLLHLSLLFCFCVSLFITSHRNLPIFLGLPTLQMPFCEEKLVIPEVKMEATGDVKNNLCLSEVWLRWERVALEAQDGEIKFGEVQRFRTLTQCPHGDISDS